MSPTAVRELSRACGATVMGPHRTRHGRFLCFGLATAAGNGQRQNENCQMEIAGNRRAILNDHHRYPSELRGLGSSIGLGSPWRFSLMRLLAPLTAVTASLNSISIPSASREASGALLGLRRRSLPGQP